ncbi:MAG: hypothetical protein HLUCCA12_08750 [Rhodobacteraceae bacterium HLUCCA12]|nr:MAG: hypothetical protein HLUCCA12_08750 [Rhodobacteraceae bacterium HLUCCA12]
MSRSDLSPQQATRAELDAGLAQVLAAPRDRARISWLCFRPAYNQRRFPERLELTRAHGIPGERWETSPWLRGPDGRGHPGIQVSILSQQVLDLVWRDRKTIPHPGDTFVVDMDLSEANLPPGQLLRAGTAVLRVSNIFNDGCAKWKVRYGADAKAWITAPGNPPLRLRGVLCAIERDGVITNGDWLEKIDAI